MKILIDKYEFNNVTKTITFTEYSKINIENVLLITNVTTNKIIYNFADPNMGGNVIDNTLVLNFNTISMNENDKLQIFYEDGLTASDVADIYENESIWLLRRMVKLLESNGTVDINGRQRVAVESILGSSLGIATTGLDSGAGTATTNRPTAAAPVSAPNAVYWQPVWIGPVDQRFQIIDAARLTYQQGIRNNLNFS
jgi:hypothetical protein